MHSNDTKDQFLELRAKGLSLARIASDLHVSQRTLVDWNPQLAPDIRALRAADLAPLYETNILILILIHPLPPPARPHPTVVPASCPRTQTNQPSLPSQSRQAPPSSSTTPAPQIPPANAAASPLISPPLRQTAGSIPHSAIRTPNSAAPCPAAPRDKLLTETSLLRVPRFLLCITSVFSAVGRRGGRRGRPFYPGCAHRGCRWPGRDWPRYPGRLGPGNCKSP